MPSLKRLIDIADYLVDERVGVINCAKESPADAGAPQFFHYYAEACNTLALSSQENFVYVGGASADRSMALAKALGEAVERYSSAIYNVEELPLYSRAEAPFRCIEPRECAFYSDEQCARPGFPFVPFDETTPVRWKSAIDPLTGEVWYVPAALVYMPYYFYSSTDDSPIVQPISTGMACHCSPAEAAISGICEVVERDALMISWQACLAHPQIRVESLSDRNYDLVQRFERTGARVTLFDITLDAGIPTILSVLRSPSPRAPATVVANSTSLSPEVAICKSLEELAHTRRFMQQITDRMTRLVPSPPMHENIVDQMTHLNFWCDHANSHLADFLWASKKRVDFARLKDHSTGDSQADLQVLCKLIRSVGHRVLIADLTTSDIGQLGLTVIRAIIPGFHPLTMGYNNRVLGGKRLWVVPKKVGHAGLAPGAADNPSPHPFP
jgi:ribosomal protein S12 methylthiotransferase accessory factor